MHSYLSKLKFKIFIIITFIFICVLIFSSNFVFALGTVSREYINNLGNQITELVQGSTYNVLVSYMNTGSKIEEVKVKNFIGNNQEIVPGSLVLPKYWELGTDVNFTPGTSQYFEVLGDAGPVNGTGKLTPNTAVAPTKMAASLSQIATGGDGGGDGYTPVLYFNESRSVNIVCEIYHHDFGPSTNPTGSRINCQDNSDGTQLPGFPKKISNDPPLNGKTWNYVTGRDNDVVQIGSKVYMGASNSENKLGILCFDLDTKTGCSPSFIPLSNAGINIGGTYASGISGLYIYNDYLYVAGNVVPGTGGSRPRLFCYDIVQNKYCTGFDINGLALNYTGGSIITAMIFSNKVIIADSALGADTLDCFNIGTGGALTRCTNYPKSTNGNVSPMHYLDSTGNDKGFCVLDFVAANQPLCYDFAGNSLTTLPFMDPANFNFGGSSYKLDTHVFYPTFMSKTYCWDFALTDTPNGGPCPIFKDNGTTGNPPIPGLRRWSNYNFGSTTEGKVPNAFEYGFNYLDGCMYSLGDFGTLWTFDPETGDSPCIKHIGATNVNSIQGTSCSANGYTNNVSKFNWIFPKDETYPAGLTSLKVTIYSDEQMTNVIPGFNSVNVPPVGLDLNSLDVTLYPNIWFKYIATGKYTQDFKMYATFKMEKPVMYISCYDVIVKDTCDLGILANPDSIVTEVASGNTFTTSTPPLKILNKPTCLGGIGDYVWNDLNGNGIQDIGELPIPNISLKLIDDTNTEISSKITDSSGKYLFSSIPSGKKYRVTITSAIPSTAITAKNAGSDATKDSDFNPTSKNTDEILVLNGVNKINEADLGINYYATISGKVFNDLNLNNVLDNTDSGKSNFKIKLYDNNNQQILNDAAGNSLSNILTDSSGNYTINNISPGSYYIKFDKGTSSATYALKHIGTITNDSDADPITGNSDMITVNEGEKVNNINAGLQIKGELGDLIFNDVNNNLVYDLGVDIPLSNIEVHLLNSDETPVMDNSGNELKAISDTNGIYKFANLITNDGTGSKSYKVHVNNQSIINLNPNYINRFDNTSTTNNYSKDAGGYLITLSETNTTNLTADFGFIVESGINGYIWYDYDRNGVQDFQEVGIKDIKIQLFNDLDQLITEQISNSSGQYSFGNISLLDNSKKYYLKLTDFTNYLITAKSQGTNQNLDSDFDQTSTKTNLFNLPLNGASASYDAGLYSKRADLGVIKSYTGAPKSFSKGEQVEFILTIKNHGLDKVTGFKLVDTLGVNLTQTTDLIPNVGTFDKNTGLITGIDLDIGDEVIFTYKAIVNSNISNTGSNTVNISEPRNGNNVLIIDPNQLNNVDSLNISINLPSINISVLKTNNVIKKIYENDIVHYTIIITNLGPSTLTSFKLSDSIPNSLEIIGNIIYSSGSYNSSTNIVDNISIAPSQTFIINYDTKVKVNQNSQISNTVTIDSLKDENDLPITDIDKTNNSSTSIFSSYKRETDLSAIKSLENSQNFMIGDIIKYKIEVKNLGQYAIAKFKLDDIQSTNLGTPSNYQVSKGVYETVSKIWQVQLDPQEIVTLTYESKILTNEILFINNETEISDFYDINNLSVTDNDLTNNKASVGILQMSTKGDVSVSKTHSRKNSFKLGEIVDFTITITNNSFNEVDQIKLVDTFPKELESLNNFTPVTGSYDPKNSIWSNLHLKLGMSTTLKVSSKVIVSEIKNITNKVEISEPHYEKNGDVNSGELVLGNQNIKGTESRLIPLIDENHDNNVSNDELRLSTELAKTGEEFNFKGILLSIFLNIFIFYSVQYLTKTYKTNIYKILFT